MARTRAMASAPRAYICLSISAAAMPIGNGSGSFSIICRRMGTATTMPTAHTLKTHAASEYHGSLKPVIMVRAGMPATSPAEETAAAALQAAWERLVSRMVKGPLGPRLRTPICQMAKAMSEPVMLMFDDQPIFRPV